MAKVVKGRSPKNFMHMQGSFYHYRRKYKKMADEQDQAFVEFVVKALVDNPDDVKTERTVDEMGVLITLHINPNDMGQVIGRMGQTAKALRTLLRVVGAKHKARVNLKIYEPEGSHRGPRREHSENAGSSSQEDTQADMDDFKL